MAVLEYEDRGLVDLDGVLLVGFVDCVVNVRFFACGNTAKDLGDAVGTDQLVEDYAGATV